MNVKPVTDTGLRGFLKWFKQVQPNQYAQLAAVLPKKVPQAFDGYHDGGWVTAGMSRDAALNKLNGIYSGKPFATRPSQALGDYYACLGITVSAPACTGVSYTSSVNANYFSTPIQVCTPTCIAVCTSDAASTGMTSTATTATVGAIVGALAGAALTASQIAAQQSLVNTQLQRAAAGLSPLTVGLPSNVPVTGSTTGIFSGSTLLILLLLGGGVLLLTGEKKS